MRKINLIVSRHILNIAIIVNTLAILLDFLLGMFIDNKLQENIRKILFSAVGIRLPEIMDIKFGCFLPSLIIVVLINYILTVFVL